ncbi:MAG: acyl-CoA dehydrogenase family protein [Candidatus Binataceae bacterium]
MALESDERQSQLASNSTDDRADLIAMAAELRPLLARNAERCERERKIVEENISALDDRNLFKVFTPRRWGGHGAPLKTALAVYAELAKGCGSTAWVEMILSITTWSASLLPDRGQEEIFTSSPHVRVGGVFTPSSTGRRVDGGYVMSGRWSFASGCHYATWAAVGVPVIDKAGNPVDLKLVYAPMSELEIEETWFVAGMEGTGSNTIVAKEVFVPDWRALSLSEIINGDYPVRANAGEPTDNYAFVPVAALVLLGPILGMGQAVLEGVTANAHKRGITYTTYARQTDSAVVHHEIGEAALRLDSAWLHAMRAAEDIHETSVAGRKMDYLSRARIRGECGYAVKLVRDAVDQLMSVGGAASFASSSVLQRFWRGVNVATRHAVAATAPSLELYGRALLGVEGNITDLI